MLVDELGLETYDLIQPSSLAWSQWKSIMRITHQCKVKFAISASYINEVDYEVAPLDTCEVMFGIPYIWDNDATFYRKENKYHLVKGDKAYLAKAHKGREKMTLLTTNESYISK